MSEDKPNSLFHHISQLPGQVVGQTLDAAKSTAALTAMFGEGWLKSTFMKNLDPERLAAMAEAGRFLKDARETAGLSLSELAESLGLKDDSLLEDIENGKGVMPIEILLRCASLIARHDPIPFMIKFLRTYNPILGTTMEQWGVMALPKQYERERRWVNMYRRHDVLRTLTDYEHGRLINYVDSATDFILDVMLKEKEATAPVTAESKQSQPKAKAKAKTKARSKPKPENDSDVDE